MIALIHIYCSTSLCVKYKSLLIHDIQVLIYRGSTNERLPGEGVAHDSYYNETDRVNNSQFLSGYFLFTVCFTVSGTFMTALCLYNNISRHIKITFMVLNFVTEILQQFPRIENNAWILNFVTEISSNFALKKIKIRFLVLITFLEPYSQNEA